MAVAPVMQDDPFLARRLTARVIDALYVEAMVLADETRGYFDQQGRIERELLPPLQRIGFSCESLKVTTRLMHVIAWLLTRRAVEAGELSEAAAADPDRRLGYAAEADRTIVAALPETARTIIGATADLYARVKRIDGGIDRQAPIVSPALRLMDRLERAF